MWSLRSALAGLLLSSIPASAAANSPADSSILRVIADSVHGSASAFGQTWENGRLTRLRIYYHGEKGPLPSAMGGLDSLRYFSIGISGITSLPREIGNLKRLDTIDISAADIGPTLPDEIGDLAELRYLSISACKTLKELPASLMKLKKLETVSFEHNSLCLADDSLRRWILSISPHALDYQSGCAASGVRQGGPARGNAPARKLALPGEGIDPAHGRDPEDEVRYYSPAGRRRGK